MSSGTFALIALRVGLISWKLNIRIGATSRDNESGPLALATPAPPPLWLRTLSASKHTTPLGPCHVQSHQTLLQHTLPGLETMNPASSPVYQALVLPGHYLQAPAPPDPHRVRPHSNLPSPRPSPTRSCPQPPPTGLCPPDARLPPSQNPATPDPHHQTFIRPAIPLPAMRPGPHPTRSPPNLVPTPGPPPPHAATARIDALAAPLLLPF